MGHASARGHLDRLSWKLLLMDLLKARHESIVLRQQLLRLAPAAIEVRQTE